MTEALNRDQFRVAVADAVSGVLNVYREVDTMLRDLTNALNEDEPRLVPLVRRLVPGAGSKNPDARYLRNYIASVFVPADAAEDDLDDEDEDEEGEEVDDEDDESASGPKRMLTSRSARPWSSRVPPSMTVRDTRSSRHSRSAYSRGVASTGTPRSVLR
jgi:hypothetical protein